MDDPDTMLASRPAAGAPRRADSPASPRYPVTPVEPLRIDDGGHWIAALLQPADGRETAALLCNPFGQEAMRCHRAFRVLTRRLAAAGVPSLRFDYVGSGESAGDDDTADLATWRRNILQADRALRERTAVRRVVWIGLGLGGTLALQACAATGPAERPAGLVLWDPVIDGAAYLQRLQRAHAYWTRREGVTDEVLGFALPAPLRAEIAALSAVALVDAATAPVTLVTGQPIAGGDDFWTGLRDRGLADGHAALDEPVRWCSNEALDDRLVPGAAVARLLDEVRRIGGPAPLQAAVGT